MDSVNKIEYGIRDLSTRSVTLFLTKAQVFREIKNVALEPGLNEIVVTGLAPTVDENSIKVDGSGSAVITNIDVESSPNKEYYDDVYPSSDDEEFDDGDEDMEDGEPAEIVDLKAKITSIEDNLKFAEDAEGNALSRITFLDAYGNSITRENETSITKSLEEYNAQRAKAFQDQMESRVQQRTLQVELKKTNDELAKVERRHEKETAKANKEKIKAETAKAKKRKAYFDEKERIRKERLSFWPKYCYTVRITLDCTRFTPMSSRRSSTVSVPDQVKFVSEKDTVPSASAADEAFNCDLLLSYVTSSAHWQPSYDLQLSTTGGNGTLCFDAMLTNTTSETWSNAKITLSTSQTTFLGLENTIPKLVPWHIRLASKNSGESGKGILQSSEEENMQTVFRTHHRSTADQKSRHEMFGSTFGAPAAGEMLDIKGQLELLQAQNTRRAIQTNASFGATRDLSNVMMQMQAPAAPAGPPPPAASRMMQPQTEAWQQQLLTQQVQMQQQQMPPFQTRESARKRSQGPAQFRADAAIVASHHAGGGYDPTIEEVPGEGDSLDYQESLVEETGLTTTYEIPGTKTLVPRFTASKQRVARINFAQVTFSHTIVAKYKPAAYLKAKFKNNSKLTLLPGDAGLTLDGSFMGRTKLPRCSSGETVGLSLGIDPAIKVIYSKPTVRRATTGTFNREDSSVYTRSVVLQNTRGLADKPVQLLVLDQVPVSEDERLRVNPIFPVGLSKVGASVSTGGPGRNEADDRGWGSAKVEMKKLGEVCWNVSLNAGKAVKLTLEYDVTTQTNETAVQC